MSDITVIIPARQETYRSQNGNTVLENTILNVLIEAKDEPEVIVVQDGEPFQDLHERFPQVINIRQGNQGTKCAINKAAEIASGKWLFKLDAHCAVSPMWDYCLQATMNNPTWVVIPRFFVLDPDKWEWQDGRHYDYFMLPFPKKSHFGPYFAAGGHWAERTAERLDHNVDWNMKLHGSCWFMSKDFYWRCLGGLDPYNGAGSWNGEDLEISLKTWLGPWGGRLVVNKTLWMAHMHRGGQRPREWPVDSKAAYRSAVWSTDYWMNNRWPERCHDIDWLIEKFWPIPGWPDDWKTAWRHA